MTNAVINAGAPLTAASLLGLEVREEPAGVGVETDALQEAVDKLARAGGKPEEVPKRAGPVKLGAGLSAVPAVLAGKIRRGDYVDFSVFPPAQPDRQHWEHNPVINY